MSVTLSELQIHTRVYLDEITAVDWADTQVTREINYAYMEVYTGVIETFEDYYRTVYSFDITANVNEYALPSDFYKIKRLEIKYTADDTKRKAIRTDFEQITDPYDSTSFGTTSRPQYELSGSYLRILPMPTETVSSGARMVYIATTPQLSSSIDTINIPFPERYARLITIGAAAELMRKGQQEEAVAAKYDLKFRMGIEQMKQELEDRYADGTKSVLDTLGEWNDFNNAIVY